MQAEDYWERMLVSSPSRAVNMAAKASTRAVPAQRDFFQGCFRAGFERFLVITAERRGDRGVATSDG